MFDKQMFERLDLPLLDFFLGNWKSKNIWNVFSSNIRSSFATDYK